MEPSRRSYPCRPVTVYRETLRQALRQAEEGIALAERLVARERGIVDQLERDGRDTKRSKALLAALEPPLQVKKAISDRLLADLESDD